MLQYRVMSLHRILDCGYYMIPNKVFHLDALL
jgi:hypothetical protein